MDGIDEIEKARSDGEWQGIYSALKYVERILGFPIPEDDPMYNDSLGEVSLEFVEEVDEWLDNVQEFGYGNYDHI
jgi:hypothetical protein